MLSGTEKIPCKRNRDRIAVLLFFLGFFIYGCLVFSDYGLSMDEMSQRGHSLLNYKFLVPSVAKISTFTVDFPSAGDLREEKSYYGVAVQLPLVLAEHLTGFQMEYNTIFLMRHFYTFLLFFLSSVCFYKCCRLFTENRLPALLGTAIYILNPRTLSDSFYNIKDLPALSLCVMTIYFGLVLLRDIKKRHMVWFAFFGALGTNVRIVLAVVLAAFLFALLLQGIAERQGGKRFFLCLGAGFLSVFFYIAMTPGVWADIFHNIKETAETFSNYTVMPGTSIYQGSTVTGDALPRTYLLFWMTVTIPVAWLVFAAVGAGRNLWLMVKLAVCRQSFSWVQYAWLALFLTAVIPMAYVLAARPVIYNGWRHFYFLYSVIALAAFSGFLAWEEWARDRGKTVWAGRCLLAAGAMCTAVWIGRNHPYEYVYFNCLVRGHVEGNYDRDYWGMSAHQAVQYICETDGNPKLKLSSYNSFSRLILPGEYWDRIAFLDDEEADYIIESYQKGADTGQYQKYYYYDKVRDFMVDGFPVCTIYKKVYHEYDSWSMYQDKESGSLSYPVNRQQIRWTEEITEKAATFTGACSQPEPLDAFFMDTTWEEIVPGTTVWLSEDGEDWLCVNELEGCRVERFAIMARLPGTIRLKYIRIVQNRLLPAYGKEGETAERYASMHIRLYRSVQETKPDRYAQTPFEKVMGHENPVFSKLALDGDLMTRWETERNQTAQMIFDIFLNGIYPVSGVRLECGPTGTGGYARKLRVFLSVDNETWTEAEVFTEDNITYYFRSMPCRYIRLMTGDPGEETENRWAIAELEVLAGAEGKTP